MSGASKAAYQAGLEGDAGALLEGMQQASPSWRIALQAELHAMLPEHHCPSVSELEQLGAKEPEPFALALFRLARLAMLRFDAVAHQRLSALAARVQGDEVAMLWCQAIAGWQMVLDGTPDPDGASELEREAARARVAPLVIEAAALTAMGALEIDDLERARVESRRAARMARTEGFPQPEYLANHVLARLRRHSGNPHFALRILGALDNVMSAVWRPWNRWETLLAEGMPQELHDTEPAMELKLLLNAAGASDAEIFADRLAAIGRATAGLAPWYRDASALCFALGLETDNPTQAGEQWARGEAELSPGGILGLGPRGESSPVYVRIAPGAPARRVLGLAAPAHGDSVTTSRPGRVVTAIAVLALAGPQGLELEPFFESVYGFKYVADLHRGAFHMLIHRIRELLGDKAVVDRVGEHWCVQPRVAIVVPDPRVAETLDDRLLSILAHRGGASAREVAAALGVPLRTAHLAIKNLVEDGSCIPAKEGRRIRYLVEDTTFQEPTRPGTAPPA